MEHNLKVLSSCMKLLQPQIRKISTQLTLNSKSHYDALGVSSKATQADVKSAYYKLSMIYHPDKNKDSEEAAKKFRDITEAYEVLGNIKTRKLYDRGLFFKSSTSGSYDDTANKFYKSRDVKSRPPVPQGRTTVYDFDEWSKAHYGSTFQRDLRFKRRQQAKREWQQQAASDVKSEQMVLLVGTFVLLGILLIYDRDFDSPQNVTVLGDSFVVTPKSQ